MTIYAGDIKLLASKIMDDVPNGGGGPSGTLIADGASNAIYTDITELDRSNGNVSIRQLFAAVRTDTTDAYMGCNIVLSKPPNDPNVSVTLAKCTPFAKRTDIANTLENYLIQSSEWAGYLFENHVAGQRSIQLLQRPGAPLPPIGRTLALVQSEGLPAQITQYVRTTKVESVTRTFTDVSGGSFVDYQATVVTCEISDALRSNFAGSPPSRSYARSSTKAVVRDTTVADAATFFGATTLTAVGAVGDSVLKVASVYTQLVPSSRTESIALDQRPASQRTLTLATTPRNIQVGTTPHTMRIRVGQENRGFAWTQMLKPRPAPGTIVIRYMALGNWYTVTDDGLGVLEGAGVGTVNYQTGSIAVTMPSMPDAGTSIMFAWGESVGYTNRLAQAAQVRPPEHIITLTKKNVKPTSVAVEWLSGAVLKTATDNGSGALTGDATGSVDYAGGVIRLTTTAMIDPGGTFSIAYEGSSTGGGEQLFTGLTPDAAGFVTLNLTDEPTPGTIEVMWITAQEVSNTSGGTMDEPSVKSTNEVVGSSTYWGWTGTRWFYTRTNGNIPMAESEPVYGWITKTTELNTIASYKKTSAKDATNSHRTLTTNTLTDDGAGGFVGGMGFALYSAKSLSVKVVSHDKSTSSYKADHEDSKLFNTQSYSTRDGGVGGSSIQAPTLKGSEYATTSVGEQQLGTVIVRYHVGPVAHAAETEAYTPPELLIDLCPYTSDAIVPGSVQFAWMGRTYTDFEGRIYDGLVDSGSIDYKFGVIKMTDYTVGSGAFTLQSLWTRRAQWTTASIFCRTQSAPVKPSGFVMNLTDTSGNAITATGDLNGNLTGPHLRGNIEYATGIIELQFGDYVLDTALTPAQNLEWWYDANDVGAVEPLKIWRPWPVDPTTLRYNTVSFFYLPIDAEILGLDPVRLPQDGRVPIYRVGGNVVVGHGATVGPVTVSNGQTINCARTRLSRVRVSGSDGVTINTGYTTDLDAGTVSVVDTTGWVQPVTIDHRIEQLARLRDVQIDGTLGMLSQLTHAFPVGSVVSSAMIAGNLKARVSAFFDQQTWDGITWSDSLIGNVATATYNDAAHPVTVTNAGALTERFALKFINTTTYQCIGEHVGVIGTGDINADFAPLNPISGMPYFTVRALGWGSGWAAGNVQFVHTVGAIYPYAAIRTVQPGPEAGIDFDFELLTRGDVDRP